MSEYENKFVILRYPFVTTSFSGSFVLQFKVFITTKTQSTSTVVFHNLLIFQCLTFQI